MGRGYEFLVDHVTSTGSLDRLNGNIYDRRPRRRGPVRRASSGGDDALHFEGFGVGATFKVDGQPQRPNSGRGDMATSTLAHGNTITLTSSSPTNTAPTPTQSSSRRRRRYRHDGRRGRHHLDLRHLVQQITGAKASPDRRQDRRHRHSAGTIFNNHFGTSGVAAPPRPRPAASDVTRAARASTRAHQEQDRHRLGREWSIPDLNNQGSVTMKRHRAGQYVRKPSPG